MKIPYVIDNIEHTLADVLNYLLATCWGGFGHRHRLLQHPRL
ncbi:MAG: hypothetical protein R2854_08950 [Caldilineaceae bacterium]